MSHALSVFAGTSPRNQSLELTPHRVLSFLVGLSNHPQIEKLLTPVGYSAAVNEQGWSLLRACGGFGGDYATSTNVAAQAIRELSDWCANSLERMDAALTHLHPAARAYVFKGLSPVSGPAAVVVVELVVDRLDDLAGTGKDAALRKDSAEEDKKALTTLATRGFDDKEIKRLHALITTAHTITPPDDSVKTVVKMTHEEALEALRAWYADWSTTARHAIEKRSDLIALGLAKRQSRASSDDAAQPVAAPAAPVVASPAPSATPAAPVAAPVGPTGSPGA